MSNWFLVIPVCLFLLFFTWALCHAAGLADDNSERQYAAWRKRNEG